MSRSVIVLSDDPDFFEHVQDVLRPDSRFIISDDIHCDGSAAPLANIYPNVMAAVEWDGWEADDNRLGDPRTMSTLVFDSGHLPGSLKLASSLPTAWRRQFGSWAQRSST